VSHYLADSDQWDTCISGTSAEGVAKIVDTKVLNSSLAAGRVPGCLDVFESRPRLGIGEEAGFVPLVCLGDEFPQQPSDWDSQSAYAFDSNELAAKPKN
jgi:hypothetical protein